MKNIVSGVCIACLLAIHSSNRNKL
jgi:hypothetical protein